MEDKMSVRQKLVAGYIPYTLGAVLLVLLLVSVAGSWAAVLAGGIIFIGWAFGLSLCQLAILCLPGKIGDRARFHTDCAMVTVANLFVAPIVVGLLIWVVSQAVRLAT